MASLQAEMAGLRAMEGQVARSLSAMKVKKVGLKYTMSPDLICSVARSLAGHLLVECIMSLATSSPSIVQPVYSW